MKRSELKKIENWQILKYGKVKKVLETNDLGKIGTWKLITNQNGYQFPSWTPAGDIRSYFWLAASMHPKYADRKHKEYYYHELAITRSFALHLIEFYPHHAKIAGLTY